MLTLTEKFNSARNFLETLDYEKANSIYREIVDDAQFQTLAVQQQLDSSFALLLLEIQRNTDDEKILSYFEKTEEFFNSEQFNSYPFSLTNTTQILLSFSNKFSKLPTSITEQKLKILNKILSLVKKIPDNNYLTEKIETEGILRIITKLKLHSYVESAICQTDYTSAIRFLKRSLILSELYYKVIMAMNSVNSTIEAAKQRLMEEHQKLASCYEKQKEPDKEKAMEHYLFALEYVNNDDQKAGINAELERLKADSNETKEEMHEEISEINLNEETREEDEEELSDAPEKEFFTIADNQDSSEDDFSESDERETPNLRALEIVSEEVLEGMSRKKSTKVKKTTCTLTQETLIATEELVKNQIAPLFSTADKAKARFSFSNDSRMYKNFEITFTPHGTITSNDIYAFIKYKLPRSKLNDEKIRLSSEGVYLTGSPVQTLWGKFFEMPNWINGNSKKRKSTQSKDNFLFDEQKKEEIEKIVANAVKSFFISKPARVKTRDEYSTYLITINGNNHISAQDIFAYFKKHFLKHRQASARNILINAEENSVTVKEHTTITLRDYIKRFNIPSTENAILSMPDINTTTVQQATVAAEENRDTALKKTSSTSSFLENVSSDSSEVGSLPSSIRNTPTKKRKITLLGGLEKLKKLQTQVTTVRQELINRILNKIGEIKHVHEEQDNFTLQVTASIRQSINTEEVEKWVKITETELHKEETAKLDELYSALNKKVCELDTLIKNANETLEKQAHLTVELSDDDELDRDEELKGPSVQ